MKKKESITIDISNIDTKSVKKQEYFLQKDAFSDLTTYLRKDLKSKNKKSKLHNRRIHNTIFINGSRGNGKTQFLLSIKNYIKIKSQENKELKNLYFFEPIDPTLLHDNESFLTIVVAKVLNNLERKKKLIVLNKKEKENFYQLLNDLAGAIDGVINNRNQIRNSLENIAQDQSSLKLEEYMDTFFSLVIKILNKKKLILLIDDVDMALYRGMHVLEVIRKYLSSPYIIPIVTGDEKLYEEIVENYFDKYIPCRKQETDIRKNQQLAIDYLIKVFPMHRRVKLQTIYQLAQTNEIKFVYNNDIYLFESYSNTRLTELGNEYLFRKHAFHIFNANEAANIFVKNLFSNSLRKLIQFLHKEYSIDKEKFSLTSIDEIKKIEQKYKLTLLRMVDSWQTYLNEGKGFFNDNKWEKAIGFFLKSLKLKETKEAFLFLGNSYDNLLGWEDAEKAYTNVIRLDPKNSNAYFKRGGIYRKKGLYQDAISDYYQSIEFNPNYDEVYNHLAICYLLTDATDLAINNFELAITLNPDSPKPYINIIETSFLENKEYYDANFEENFIQKFKHIKHVMKAYSMIDILKKVREENSEIVTENMFEEWNIKYKNIKYPEWSFSAFHNMIKKEPSITIREKLKYYLEKFEMYM